MNKPIFIPHLREKLHEFYLRRRNPDITQDSHLARELKLGSTSNIYAWTNGSQTRAAGCVPIKWIDHLCNLFSVTREILSCPELATFQTALDRTACAVNGNDAQINQHNFSEPTELVGNILLNHGSQSMLSIDRVSDTQITPGRSDFLREIEHLVRFIDGDAEGYIRIVGVSDQWPGLNVLRCPTPEWRDFRFVPSPSGNAERDEQVLIANGYKAPASFSENRNETIGLVCGVRDECSVLDYYPIKYRMKLALRDEKRPHATVSAGSLIVGESGNVLYVHERTLNRAIVHEAYGQRHTFCGSMRVEGDGLHDRDITLRRACHRETQEESGAPTLEMRDGKIAIVYWHQNVKTNGGMFSHEGVDIVYLGAIIKDMYVREMWTKGNILTKDLGQLEGVVDVLKIDEQALYSEFTESYGNWFFAGVAHHLIWLAVGAPGANEMFREQSRHVLAKILDYFSRKGLLQK